MKKTDIELIIKKGSIRQKIKLYFTDIAYFNIKGVATADFKGSGDNFRVELRDRILTDKERDLIFNSIKDPKDVRYYNEMITWNRAFLLFRDSLTADKNYFKYIRAYIYGHSIGNNTQHSFIDVINNIFEEIKDEKLREKLVNKAVKELKPFNAYKYQEKGLLPYIDVKYYDFDKLVDIIIVLNNKTKETKEYIETLKTFLNKQLPLQPYKEFLKYEEDKIKVEIEQCKKYTEKFILTESFTDELKKINILRWDEVEVKVTDEDIEDIKNAGR
jgi:hypothetical protein